MAVLALAALAVEIPESWFRPTPFLRNSKATSKTLKDLEKRFLVLLSMQCEASSGMRYTPKRPALVVDLQNSLMDYLRVRKVQRFSEKPEG